MSIFGHRKIVKGGICLAVDGQSSRRHCVITVMPMQMCRAARGRVDAESSMENSDEEGVEDDCLDMDSPNIWDLPGSHGSSPLTPLKTTGRPSEGLNGPSGSWREASHVPRTPDSAVGALSEDLLLFPLDFDSDTLPDRSASPFPPTPRSFPDTDNSPFRTIAESMQDPSPPVGTWGMRRSLPRQLSSTLESEDGMSKALDVRLRSPASMAAGNMFPLRPAQTVRNNPKPRRAKGAARKGAAYPPKVVCARGDNVFSGLDEQEWRKFMADLQQQIAEALAEGRWRQPQLGKPAYGMSCPRF